MSAKEMFEELGYECFDDRDDKEHLPLTITYYEPYRDLGDLVAFVEFVLPDKKWRTNIVNIKQDIKLMQAINKQVDELGWLGEKENE